MYEPDSGTITIDGIPIQKVDHEYYHERVALVAQQPILYNGTVRQNILYGCDWATEEDMLEAARKANVHNFVMELDKKYDTMCGDKGVQMSGEFFLIDVGAVSVLKLPVISNNAMRLSDSTIHM
ncbi:hypothetical protein OESDEN_19979 [Oesophagostomum dentatum]|uniref:ABC transporter domain-containing protein n=1 Tax=Oesophagostomum dentatum TaxID=61180 RepID=A0A0B1S4R9_OESDE|nr:hypothetical protein OESDEN_19979 [Oesophagostomum dentatum]